MGYGKIYKCVTCGKEWSFLYGSGFSHITLSPFICNNCGEITDGADIAIVQQCQKCNTMMDQIKEQTIVDCPDCKIALKEIGYVEWD